MPGRVRIAWQNAEAALHFVRFSFLALTGVLPLLGVASVTARISVAQTLGIVGIALAFHVFAYISNDVADLRIDRTEALRSNDLLVSGALHPGVALVVALAAVPCSAALTAWMGGSLVTYASLALAYVGLAIYNVYGKRATFPILTDFIQGAGWAGLVLYGAFLCAPSISWATTVLAGDVAVFVAFVNGVHGNLRDVANDYAQKAHTTAILLGVRPGLGRTAEFTLRFILYAALLQALHIGVVIVFVVFNPMGYPFGTHLIVAVVTFGIVVLSLCAPVLCLAAQHNLMVVLFGGFSHVALSLAALVALYTPALAPAPRLALLAIFCVPLTRGFALASRAVWMSLRRSTGRPVSRMREAG